MKVEALLGVDTIQYFPTFQFNRCMKGQSIKVGNKYIPFGNIESFLTNSQIKELKENEILNEKLKTPVNLILNPTKSYFSPLEHVLTDSVIEQGLENLFSLESIGISSEEDEICDYDIDQINIFENNITFENGHYHIILPWHINELQLVPNNWHVALKVLENVIKQLKTNNLMDKYDDIFSRPIKK